MQQLGQIWRHVFKSIFNDIQYVTLQKYLSHPNFSLLFFSNPTYKTKFGFANKWKIVNNNPPKPIKLPHPNFYYKAI
jgi:hypothetical protein